MTVAVPPNTAGCEARTDSPQLEGAVQLAAAVGEPVFLRRSHGEGSFLFAPKRGARHR